MNGLSGIVDIELLDISHNLGCHGVNFCLVIIDLAGSPDGLVELPVFCDLGLHANILDSYRINLDPFRIAFTFIDRHHLHSAIGSFPRFIGCIPWMHRVFVICDLLLASLSGRLCVDRNEVHSVGGFLRCRRSDLRIHWIAVVKNLPVI